MRGLTMSGTAPIAVFAYRRPEHVERLLQSLAANPESALSPVYVFCDGPKTATECASVDRTRQAVREFSPRHASIVYHEHNLGLAHSIISGVTQLCEEHGRAIVLEDDLILSGKALAFLNCALNTYERDERVMHVSGYVFPANYTFPQTFFYRSTSCWGWATWARAWKHFIADGTRIRRELKRRRLEHYFDIDGAFPYMKMLDDQIAGKNDSWAIRWYGSVTLKNGFALHPGRSFVSNEGFDGSGSHCGRSSQYDVALCEDFISCDRVTIAEHLEAVDALKKFFSVHIPPHKPASLRAHLKRVALRVFGGVRSLISEGVRQ